MAAFSLLEVCIAAVVLAIIGAQMYQLSSLTRENFQEAKNYLDADQKLYSEIAFARNAAQRYTWCDALSTNGVDQDATYERKTVTNDAYSKIADFCADEFYKKAPASVYKPPYILTQTDSGITGGDRKCYSLQNGTTAVAIGTLKIVKGSEDKCERDSAHSDATTYPEYMPWVEFLKKCQEDMHNNTYEPTQSLTQFPEYKSDGKTLHPDRTPAESDPIVGNLVKQLRAHAENNKVMTKYYNRSSIDQKMTHRIVLFYTVNLDVNGATRSVTRVLQLTAPVAAWCPY